MPLTNLSVFTQGNFSLIDARLFYDYQVGLQYSLDEDWVKDLSFTLGYQNVNIESENLYTDIELKSAFIGVITYF
ncbi:hypothetical protein CXF74_21415 [Psychromonas sp. Urea-02u-13]|nr:hypothetical protein CXF74_21415 [Psychromonas sp. Urea-02u-13]